MKNNTEYIKTLDIYLSERNDINKTAKRLHLHRNTLIYRLGKIKEITALDVNAPDSAWKLQIGLNAARIAGIISD